MRWFKHDVDMHTDLKIQNLIEKYGLEGYAIWCLCLEMLGKEGEKGRLDSKTGWLRGLLRITRWSGDVNKSTHLENILSCMGKLNLINSNSLKHGHLHIPNFTKRADDYTARKIRTEYEQTSDNVHVDIDIEEDIEENKNKNKTLILYFADLYKQKLDKSYLINWGKESAIMRWLLVTLTPDEIQSLMTKFFSSADPFIKQAGFTIGVFKSMVNRLRSDKPKKSIIKEIKENPEEQMSEEQRKEFSDNIKNLTEKLSA